jgi:hypothetical protein
LPVGSGGWKYVNIFLGTFVLGSFDDRDSGIGAAETGMASDDGKFQKDWVLGTDRAFKWKRCLAVESNCAKSARGMDFKWEEKVDREWNVCRYCSHMGKE